MFKEFRDFIMRGNVVDLAIGIIIGAAFTTVVDSLVNDILMPPIGMLLGGVDFANLFINLSGGGYTSLAAAQEAGAATINYGVFLNSLISFLIVALAVFFIVKGINRMRESVPVGKKAEPEPEEEVKTKQCPFCYTMIPYEATRCPNCTSDLGIA